MGSSFARVENPCVRHIGRTAVRRKVKKKRRRIIKPMFRLSANCYHTCTMQTTMPVLLLIMSQGCYRHHGPNLPNQYRQGAPVVLVQQSPSVRITTLIAKNKRRKVRVVTSETPLFPPCWWMLVNMIQAYTLKPAAINTTAHLFPAPYRWLCL